MRRNIISCADCGEHDARIDDLRSRVGSRERLRGESHFQQLLGLLAERRERVGHLLAVEARRIDHARGARVRECARVRALVIVGRVGGNQQRGGGERELRHRERARATPDVCLGSERAVRRSRPPPP
jgi:hypothetical protein